MSSITATPASILILDHDQFALASMAQLLEGAGYHCHCARDPETARRIARAFPLDVILCDVRLDQVSGLDACVELRRQPGMEEVPVVYISAAQMPDIVRRSHEAGGAYYLRKPVDPDVLLEIVSKALWMPHLVNSKLRYEQGGETPRPAGLGKSARGELRRPWRRSSTIRE